MPEIQIQGLEKFKQDLERLDFGKRTPALVAGILRAVEPFRIQAGSEAPKDTGLLSESIVAQEDKKNSSLSSVTVSIGATAKAFYGFFQEYGTAHHVPQAFFEPALDDTIDEINDNIVDFIQQEINKALTA